MRPVPEWPTRDLLDHRVRATPTATALLEADDGTTWTYAALDAAVDRAIAEIGDHLPDALDDGDARPWVGIAATTDPSFVTALFATWRLGAVAVPLATDRPAADRQRRLDRLDLDLALASDEGAFDGVRPDCPVQRVDPAPGGGESAVPGERPRARWQPVETALCLFTSGTTGRPKGVRLTHRNLVASATASAFRLGVQSGDRWHCCLPTNHMGGLAPIVRSTLYGTTAILQSAFDATETGRAMATHGATGVSLVPTMLRRLLEAGWEPPESLRFVLLGGAPASADLLRDCTELVVPVYPTYGTTETASQIATSTPEEVADDPATVGSPLVSAEVTIVDPETDSPVEPGSVGEIVVDGPVVTPGYLEAPDDPFGEWGFHTGDLGRLDDAGRLEIRGRLDDAIQTGGETVHPELVASAVRAQSGVDDAAVVGLPDEEWGERVVVLVVPVDPGTVDPGDLEDRLREELAPYAVPKEVAVADALPRTDSGTVDRDAVRERFRD